MSTHVVLSTRGERIGLVFYCFFLDTGDWAYFLGRRSKLQLLYISLHSLHGGSDILGHNGHNHKFKRSGET